ncbi:DUF1598 domain-containing protein [Botrimarina hoheduenensis]|uniref:DUF1598 domain-containing protein n=1 Tax=Botrimarina hoheduenensis TaxID=2528000 RepID=UPI0018D2B801|nr:DUF1598 domain-containing protein [Botrimarina hoheduenensis]
MRLSLAAGLFAGAFILLGGAVPADAGGLIRAPAVGGIYIDTEGVVSAPAEDATEQLRAAWEASLAPVPENLDPLVDLRMVSLRGVEAALAESARTDEPLPDAVRYLAGLQRVQFVFVHPPKTGEPGSGDIVLAGPAEGWRVDELGNTVGKTTGRPVVMLEDLIVGLRAAEAANGPGISCSIDPTPGGLVNAQRVNLTPQDGPLVAARKLEQAIGQQVITISGTPSTSHFARSLVAADFRMKRLAMGFEPAPIAGLPSYLDLIQRMPRSSSMLPRWWLATNYQPLAKDNQGLAWELRGQGVKCLAEQDYIDADGKAQRGAKAGGDASRWADRLTENFEDLSAQDSAFGQVRNAFDVAVVGALLLKEGLWDASGLVARQLNEEYVLEAYEAPEAVATKAAFVKKRGGWVISASGGVQVYPWLVANETVTENERLTNVSTRAVAPEGAGWWW